MAATKAMPSMPRVAPRPWVVESVPWMYTTTQATAKVPNMKTSEWAKLISCRTPYTIV